MKNNKMNQNTKSIIGAATLTLGLALGVNSLSEAKGKQFQPQPKLEGGKEGLKVSDQHKHSSDASAGKCDQHKMENSANIIKGEKTASQHKMEGAGYVKFEGVEGNCIKGEGANMHKIESGQHKIEGAQIKLQESKQHKMESQEAGQGADFIKK